MYPPPVVIGEIAACTVATTSLGRGFVAPAMMTLTRPGSVRSRFVSTATRVTWGLALPIGIYSAVRQYSIGDYAITTLGFILSCALCFVLSVRGFKSSEGELDLRLQPAVGLLEALHNDKTLQAV